MAGKLSVEKETVLWKDRKRILGMPISFTRYEVCEDRLTLRKGFFNTVTDEILIYRIMDLRLARSLGQKIFRVGTVTLLSADKSHPELELKNIAQPETVLRFLSGLIETQRDKRNISGREFIGDIDDDNDGMV